MPEKYDYIVVVGIHGRGMTYINDIRAADPLKACLQAVEHLTVRDSREISEIRVIRLDDMPEIDVEDILGLVVR